MKLPSLTAKIRSLFTTIQPDGCKSVSVKAISPTNFSQPKLATYPSSLFCPPGEVKSFQNFVFVIALNKRTKPKRPPMIPMTRPLDAWLRTSSPTGMSGNNNKYNPHKIKTIPAIPGIPNPGITKASRIIHNMPIRIIRKSFIVASSAI